MDACGTRDDNLYVRSFTLRYGLIVHCMLKDDTEISILIQ